jgi:hypothetical protein
MNKYSDLFKYPSGRNIGKDLQIQILTDAIELAIAQLMQKDDEAEGMAKFYIEWAVADHFGLYLEWQHYGCNNYPFCEDMGCGGEPQYFGHK